VINLENTIKIHQILIEEFGGTKGIRDLKLLESALSRPFQTFHKKDLYPSTIEKAAALIESILVNHPFLDGNKRIGYVLMRLLLLEDEMDIKATQEDKYNFVIAIAKGELSFDKITDWIDKNSSNLR
jgi:death-on-curing protein